MKHLVVIPSIIGSVLMVAGGAVFAVGLAGCSKKNTLTHEFALEGEFTDIDFNLNISDVKFNATTDGTKKVVFKETDKMHHTYSVSEGKLKIGFEDTRKWYDKMFTTEHFTVDLYIPSAHYGELTVNSSTGDFLVPSEFYFNNVNIKVSTGDVDLKCSVSESLNVTASTGKVNLNSLNAKNISLTADTGSAVLNEVKAEEKITVRRSTGNIIMTTVRAKDYESNSSTGRVELNDVIMDNHIKIKTSTGDVKFDGSDAATLNIETSTGDVKGTLLTSKIFYVKTDTGKVNVPTSTEGGLCEITTDTGDVNISIKA